MTGSFLKVKCEKCNNEQNIYEKAATKVHCLVCSEIIAEPRSGRAMLSDKVKILKSLG
jgi:small subunit ribosomal protein S27e